MINQITISTLLVLFSTVLAVPRAIAQAEAPNDTRIEKYEDLTETQPEPSSQAQMEDMESEDMEDMESEDMKDMEGMEDMESEGDMSEPSTRTEETMQEAQSNDMSTNNNVRNTEAFNLVSSAYRGDFEEQGLNGYAVFVSDYEAGNVTAEDVIQAGIDAGELSPSALEDDRYVQAVQSQLDALTQS